MFAVRLAYEKANYWSDSLKIGIHDFLANWRIELGMPSQNFQMYQHKAIVILNFAFCAELLTKLFQC
jgi:hypothetical protein